MSRRLKIGKRRKPKTGKKRQRHNRRHRPISERVWAGPADDQGYYPPFWTREFKAAIRASQGFRCGWCGSKQGEDVNSTLHVHHLNIVKRDCRRKNLVALCEPCHCLLAHKGKYSSLKGEELRKATEFQELMRLAWAKVLNARSEH